MTKAELAANISRTTNIEKTAVTAVIEAFMDEVKQSLSKGENVYLRGFGAFLVKKRAAKTARNIRKNTSLLVPEHNTPAFKPAPDFKDAVAKGGK